MGGFGSPGGGRGRGGKGRGRGGGKGGRGRGGGKGKGRGKGGKGKGKGKGGAKGGAKVVVEPHRHEGVFIARGKEDVIVTLNSTPGKDVYGEKRISVDGPANEDGTTTKIEYRVWNPFRSKLCAAILGGVDTIHMKPGSKVLYLGGAAGTTVSHVSDLVGPQGCVYAVEFSHRPGRDLINMAKHRTNVIPIIEDARHPLKYRMLVGMVDCVFADVAQPDQARIVALNSQYFLKAGGGFVVSIKASCIDSTATPEAVFAAEVAKLQKDQFKPKEQLTLEPYERDHAVVVGLYRPPNPRPASFATRVSARTVACKTDSESRPLLGLLETGERERSGSTSARPARPSPRSWAERTIQARPGRQPRRLLGGRGGARRPRVDGRVGRPGLRSRLGGRRLAVGSLGLGSSAPK